MLKIPTKNMMYYYQTLLKAGCSHCVVLPKKTDSKHTYVLRNYDLSPKIDDMRFVQLMLKVRMHIVAFLLNILAERKELMSMDYLLHFQHVANQ